MSTVVRKVVLFRCLRCSHEWQSRTGKARPNICPTCKSQQWDTPRPSGKLSPREKVAAS